MQKLYFEAAWERTIAQNDREKIIKIFEKVQPTLSSGVHFTFLWAAKNHENETLIVNSVKQKSKLTISKNETDTTEVLALLVLIDKNDKTVT